MRGSKQQQPMAFVFDSTINNVLIKRPSYNSLREAQEMAEVVDDKTKAGRANVILEAQAELAADKVVKSGVKPTINNTTINEVNSTNDKIETIAGDQKVGDTSEESVDNILKKNLLSNKPEDKGTVGLSKLKSKVEGVKGKINKKELVGEKSNPNKNYSKLQEYLSSIGGPRRFKLASMLGLSDGNVSTF